MRRSWLKGVVDVTKRYVIAVAAHNLGRILRKLFGIGKPKTLQGGYADETLARAYAASRIAGHELPDQDPVYGGHSERNPARGRGV